MIPDNNPDLVLLGTGEFSFSEGATNLAMAQLLGWRDLGNIKTFKVDTTADAKEHMSARRGIVRRDRIIRTGLKAGYMLTADEIDQFTLSLFYMGTAGATMTTQAALAAVPGTAIVFTAPAPSQPGFFYDLYDAAGNHVHDLTAVTIAGKVEGTDFELDRKVGRIRFLTQQVASVTPTLTAAAIAAGAAGSRTVITPYTKTVKSGLGRLRVFDDNVTDNVVWSHFNFTCQLAMDSGTDVKGDDFGDFQINVSVTNDPGIVHLRAFNV